MGPARSGMPVGVRPSVHRMLQLLDKSCRFLGFDLRKSFDMTSPDTPTSVGQQLSARREELDLTQQAVATSVGVTVNSVSAAENDRATISRGKRPGWERALGLEPGTIHRAYTQGTDLEFAEPRPRPEVYADLTDRYEAAVWAIAVSEEDRIIIIDLLREAKAEERRRSA